MDTDGIFTLMESIKLVTVVYIVLDFTSMTEYTCEVSARMFGCVYWILTAIFFNFWFSVYVKGEPDIHGVRDVVSYRTYKESSVSGNEVEMVSQKQDTSED